MTTKAKLAFDMLEKEMEVISLEQMGLFKGGYDSNSYNSNGSNPPGYDCFFHAFSGVLSQMGMSTSALALEELYNYKYGSHASDGGVPTSREKEFMAAYFAGCGISVRTAPLASFDSTLYQKLAANGDKFIGHIDLGDGMYHAVTIKGMDSNGNYIYDDVPNGLTDRTISPSHFVDGIQVFTTPGQ